MLSISIYWLSSFMVIYPFGILATHISDSFMNRISLVSRTRPLQTALNYFFLRPSSSRSQSSFDSHSISVLSLDSALFRHIYTLRRNRTIK